MPDRSASSLIVERCSTLGGRLVALAVALFAFAAPAAAQWQMFSLADRPPVTERAVRMMERIVDLDQAQLELVQALQDEAEAEFSRIAEIMDSIQEDARNEAAAERDQSIWFDLFDRLREFVDRREDIREDFIDNAQLVLTADQQDAWERYERRYYRNTLYDESAAQYGSVPGVTVDIEEAVEAAEVDDVQIESLRPLLDQYSRELHAKLRDLERAAEDNMTARMEAMEKMREGGGWDRELMNRGMDRIAELIDAIRDINVRYERQIANQLPQERRVVFQRVYNKAAFPSIYRDDAAAGRFRAALQRDDLSDEQRQTLTDLQEQFLREADAIRARLRAEAMEKNPIEEFAGRGFRFGGREDDQDDDEEALRELNERFVAQIDNVLTPEQREDLGAGDPSNWRNRSFDRR